MLKCQFKPRLLLVGLAATALALLCATSAVAQVTVSEATSMDFSLFKAHGTKTERISGDKSRVDNELHCEGMMSMICGNQKSGEIIRIDKNLTWALQPDKESYLEKPFPTPEQIALVKQRIAAATETMKQCPRPAERSAPDTSKCEMSPPKIDINRSDDTATLAGHKARRTSVTLTQTCTNKETGDACDMIFAFDSWLTQDEIAGTADLRSFRRAYQKKLGLDEVSSVVSGQMQTYLAPYADTLRKLSAKAGDFHGYPLKTTMRVSMGGEHCGQATKARQQASPGVGTVVSDAIANSPAGALGSKLIGGLFGKKSTPPEAPVAQSGAGTPGTAGAPVSLLEISVETTAIDTGAIAGDQFEVPVGWKKLLPKPEKEYEAPQCPKPSS
jgi:hypothetical protein